MPVGASAVLRAANGSGSGAPFGPGTGALSPVDTVSVDTKGKEVLGPFPPPGLGGAGAPPPPGPPPPLPPPGGWKPPPQSPSALFWDGGFTPPLVAVADRPW